MGLYALQFSLPSSTVNNSRYVRRLQHARRTATHDSLSRMRTLCFLSARNLGDAVLHADFLRRLQRANRADRWIVWTFSQASFLFEGLPNTEIICSDFPMGMTGAAFVKKGGWRSFLVAVRRIRHKMPDEAVEVVGDLRERLALRLTGAPCLHSPEWETGHPFRLHIHALPFRPGRPMSVPAAMLNLHDALALMLDSVAPGAPIESGRPLFTPFRSGQNLHIGLHPSASVPFKLWPAARWIELVKQLCETFPGSSFTLFGAPKDRPALQDLADSLDAPHNLFTESLHDFKDHLSKVDILIGLDSFSVHLAQSQSVPSIVLVGTNDPRIFTPPGAVSVTHPGRCPAQPCGGRPSCIGTNYQYSCMNDITPQDVLHAMTLASGLIPTTTLPKHDLTLSE